MKEFPIGISVIATPKVGDFDHEFVGTVVSHNNGFIQVKDQEDNVFDCDIDQLQVNGCGRGDFCECGSHGQ